MIRMKKLTPMSAVSRIFLLLALVGALMGPPRLHGQEPSTDSPMVKLLKSGRLPADRQGTVIEMIGRRGTVADLDYIESRALDPSAPVQTRARALDAMAEAATTRGVVPSKDRDRLAELLTAPATPESTILLDPAIRLAGAWRLRSASDRLRAIASTPQLGEVTRDAAIEALAQIGGTEGRKAINALSGRRSPIPIRIAAIAALTRLDPEAAASAAVSLLPEAVEAHAEVIPMIEAFVTRRGGGALLAKAIERRPPTTDAARLALRAAYSLSQTDPTLIEALGKVAGIATEVRAPSPAELAALVSEVAAKGNPARGEAVFRRKDLNCFTCHAIAHAGGEIGPDLSAVGQTSPVDYLIHSVLLPDQAIKEQYHTMVVLTSDGQVYQGVLVDKDDRRVILRESTGALRTIPVDAIEDQKPGGSLMPKGLVNLMTHGEFVDLIRFLSELGKPGPYAIRTVPTIQRWQVLTSAPADLAGEVPRSEVLREQVLRAGPDRWATVYARVSGALPLNEATALSGGSKVLYLRGEIDVTVAGEVQVRPQFPDGIRFWVDDVDAPLGTAEFTTIVPVGRHPIVVRVDTSSRKEDFLRIEIVKPEGSKAEFTVVGGR